MSTIDREIGSTLSLLRESLRSGEFRSEDLQDRIIAATRKCRRWEKRVSANASGIALVEAISVSATEIENFARNYCRDPIPRSNIILLWLLATLTLMQSSLSVGDGIYQRGGNAVFAGGVFYIVGLLQDGAFGLGGDRRLEAFGVAGIAQATRSNWAVVSELLLVGVILVLLFR
ncbi:MAG: hypothetical protein HC774_07185 [Sphingomonadales bacterium]|nr:hypothetical protein [Sphingomonadales bacterium]